MVTADNSFGEIVNHYLSSHKDLNNWETKWEFIDLLNAKCETIRQLTESSKREWKQLALNATDDRIDQYNIAEQYRILYQETKAELDRLKGES